MTGPTVSGRLVGEIREALARTERGESVDLGSFDRYAGIDADGAEDPWCGYCGRPFTPKTAVQRYCSPTHRSKAKRRRRRDCGKR